MYFYPNGEGGNCLLQNELTAICVECREVGAVEIIHWKTEREEELLSKEAADRDQSRKNHKTMGKGRREGKRARERERERERKRERERERERGGREGERERKVKVVHGHV